MPNDTSLEMSLAELHVATAGCDQNSGSRSAPLKTIQRAAELAQPGTVVTVHAGVYRERVAPPRGGTSEAQRIIYRAAPGEHVEIKGSEIVKNWTPLSADLWKVVLPNSLFAGFNPYENLIHGDWFVGKGRQHHTGAVYFNGLWLSEATTLEEMSAPSHENPLWFGRVGEGETTLWAHFPGVDPNEQPVEVNVRQTVFYPERPGCNFITVRGFTMRHAATPWAPPTAEQIGLIGTHWSKGWIIEENTISHSACTGLTLGNYGDEFDNKSATADAYHRTVDRALAQGWNKETVGSHLVRNNTISHCEQAGIAGSLGAAFSTITGNHIHDIHVRQLFEGAEMAGIKIHGAIDMEISRNYLHHVGGYSCVWLDWMAQGTQILSNLFHDNSSHDLFFEVNHGPILVANNIFLSQGSVWNASRGVAFVHNLFAGEVTPRRWFAERETPFHPAHSTELAGSFHHQDAGDDRFYNNIFTGIGFDDVYPAYAALAMEGNVFFDGARHSAREKAPLLQPAFNPAIQLVSKKDGIYLQMKPASFDGGAPRRMVDTALLGRTAVSQVAFEKADGSRLRIATDYCEAPRDPADPMPGPWESVGELPAEWKVWSAG